MPICAAPAEKQREKRQPDFRQQSRRKDKVVAQNLL
jgi:hypothetical protein